MPKWIMAIITALGPIATLINNIFFKKKTSGDTHDEVKDLLEKRKKQEGDKKPPKDRFPGV